VPVRVDLHDDILMSRGVGGGVNSCRAGKQAGPLADELGQKSGGWHALAAGVKQIARVSKGDDAFSLQKDDVFLARYRSGHRESDHAPERRQGTRRRPHARNDDGQTPTARTSCLDAHDVRQREGDEDDDELAVDRSAGFIRWRISADGSKPWSGTAHAETRDGSARCRSYFRR